MDHFLVVAGIVAAVLEIVASVIVAAVMTIAAVIVARSHQVQ